MADMSLADIINPNRGWRMFHWDEVYRGGSVEGKIVPNVGDALFSWVKPMERVYEVDYTTGLSKSIPDGPPAASDQLTDEDILLGAYPGHPRESNIIFVDDSVLPRRLSFDSRLKMPGSKVAYVKVFFGSNIESDGEVVSRTYDSSLNVTGENIPMIVSKYNTDGTVSEKVPANAYISRSVNNKDVLTAVFYTLDNVVQSVCQLLVYNSRWIRDLDATQRIVTGIHLQSPNMSEADNRTLLRPINLPAESIMLQGVVTYLDGKQRTLPVDGTKFYLMGLYQNVSTQLGYRQPFSLAYRLGDDEVYQGSQGNNQRLVIEPYTAVSTKVDGAYAVKLFGYPEWVDGINGYRMRYWLYNLERDQYFEVTSLVELTSSSAAFEPLGYGFRQQLNVALDLSRVSNEFKAHRHLQNIYVTLRAHGTEDTTTWSVNFDINREDYGIGLFAEADIINQNLWNVNITSGITTIEEWLTRMFTDIRCVYDETAEVKAPDPTHFKLVVGNFEQVYPLQMWNSVFTLSSSLADGRNVYVHFFRRTATEDLQLGVAAIPCRHV